MFDSIGSNFMNIEIIPNWHPIFVHFPIALVAISTLSFLLGVVTRQSRIANELIMVSKWCMWFAGMFAIVTAYTGWSAYNSVAHDGLSHQAMTLHRNWALATALIIVIFAVVVFSFRNDWGQRKRLLSLSALIILTGLISVTAWLGAEAVYRYGIGVQSLPETDTPHLHDSKGENHGHHDLEIEKESNQNNHDHHHNNHH